MPHGSALPSTKAIASASWAMYSVSCSMTSEPLESDSSVARRLLVDRVRPGLSAMNSGSVMIASGLPAMPG